jgi:ADP-heptose:LPS heptosyltransferase
MREPVLVHLGAGIGNVVLATPLLVALGRMDYTIDLWLSADYPETADLFTDWATVRRVVDGIHGRYVAYVPAVPPFYWPAFPRRYAALAGVVPRPPDSLFWTDEQAYYLSFARALGYDGPSPAVFLPVSPCSFAGVTESTVLLAPGCKTGEMAAKRWPWFAELANRLEDVAVVGTADDLRLFDGRRMDFAPHVRMLAGHLTLRQTAELLAAVRVVVANDSGLAHMAAAVGTRTLMLFGPTPHLTLGELPPNVSVLRAGLPCEPCWFGGARFRACGRRIDCLQAITVDDAQEAIERALRMERVPAEWEPARALQ